MHRSRPRRGRGPLDRRRHGEHGLVEALHLAPGRVPQALGEFQDLPILRLDRLARGAVVRFLRFEAPQFHLETGNVALGDLELDLEFETDAAAMNALLVFPLRGVLEPRDLLLFPSPS